MTAIPLLGKTMLVVLLLISQTSCLNLKSSIILISDNVKGFINNLAYNDNPTFGDVNVGTDPAQIVYNKPGEDSGAGGVPPSKSLITGSSAPTSTPISDSSGYVVIGDPVSASGPAGSKQGTSYEAPGSKKIQIGDGSSSGSGSGSGSGSSPTSKVGTTDPKETSAGNIPNPPATSTQTNAGDPTITYGNPTSTSSGSGSNASGTPTSSITSSNTGSAPTTAGSTSSTGTSSTQPTSTINVNGSTSITGTPTSTSPTSSIPTSASSTSGSSSGSGNFLSFPQRETTANTPTDSTITPSSKPSTTSSSNTHSNASFITTSMFMTIIAIISVLI